MKKAKVNNTKIDWEKKPLPVANVMQIFKFADQAALAFRIHATHARYAASSIAESLSADPRWAKVVKAADASTKAAFKLQILLKPIIASMANQKTSTRSNA